MTCDVKVRYRRGERMDMAEIFDGIVSVELGENEEDGSYVILWKEDGTGDRIPTECVASVKMVLKDLEHEIYL